MVKFPEPPSVDRLVQLGPRLHRLGAGLALWRIYIPGATPPRQWYTFRAYGPMVSARFDHHLPPPRLQARSIYYAAASGVTCVAEVFQGSRIVEAQDPTYWLVGFETVRDLALLDLRGSWPTAAGASMAINSGLYSRSQRWSQAVYAAYPQIDGLWYCSSMHANEPAVALYERGESALPRSPFFHKPLSDPLLRVVLENAAREFGYEVIT